MQTATIINGTGFYHLESETRSGKKTDIIVELKRRCVIFSIFPLCQIKF